MKCLSHTTIKRFYRTLLYGGEFWYFNLSYTHKKYGSFENKHREEQTRQYDTIHRFHTFNNNIQTNCVPHLCCCQLCIWRSMWETPRGMLFPVFLKLCLRPSLWTTLQQSHHHWQTQQNISGGSCLPEGVGCAGALPLGPSTKERSHQILEHVS